MSSPGSSPATLIAGLALLVSAGHLMYALTTGPSRNDAETRVEKAPLSTSTSTPSPDCRCDDAVLRGELIELRDTIAQMQRSSARTIPPVPGMGVDEPPASRATPARIQPTERELEQATPGDQHLPKIQLFMDIPRGVRLSQRPDGTIEATAIDPETSGEEYLVYVITESGETMGVRVSVP